ncbi:MAG TPA: hypothetical protein VF743_02480, partial [Acidimicrobiales bacterium]
MAGVVAAVIAAGEVPAGAQVDGPTFTVTPTSFDVQRGEVQITWADVPMTGSPAIGQCVGQPADPNDIQGNCRLITFVSEP